MKFFIVHFTICLLLFISLVFVFFTLGAWVAGTPESSLVDILKQEYNAISSILQKIPNMRVQ